jgi:hypothetical protein
MPFSFCPCFQIAATDAQIDRLVSELYDLTPEEIAIVEGAASLKSHQIDNALADSPGGET